ncbi:MAG TPA: hypothetical protein VFF73_38675 [Planctomycetota bacterium]|nr:hypothetical protein [Planctomycetota bacterium]
MANLLLEWIGLPSRVLRAALDRTELTRVAEPLDNLIRVEPEGEGPCWLLLEVMAEWKTGYEKTVRDHWENARRARKPALPVVLVLRKGHGRTTMRAQESLESSALGVTVEIFRFYVVKLWEISADDLAEHGPAIALPFVPFAGNASETTVRASFERLSRKADASRNDLLMALAVNSSRVFPTLDGSVTIPPEIRMKSPFLDQIVAERTAALLAEATLEAKRDMVARWMRARCGPRKAAPLIASLRTASDAKLSRATQLLESVKDDDALLAALKKLLPARRSHAR